MRCEDVQKELVSFVLNELSDTENKAITDHLSSCEKCRTEVAIYKKTISALSRWKVPRHSNPSVFALSPSSPSPGRMIRSEKRSLWKVVDYGIRAAFVAAVAAAFIFGTRIQYTKGGLTINVGNVGAQPVSMDSTNVAAFLEKAQRQNLQLVSQMIQASEARQAEINRSDFASLSRQVDNRQRNYITYLMNHIYRLQQQDQLAYYQSRAALDGMVKLANAVR